MRAYLTVEEYKRVPAAINVSNLDYFSGLSDGSAQDAELNNVIIRASAYMDNYCLALDGFYAGTITETRQTYITRDGVLHIRPKNMPLVEVKSLQYRLYPLNTWSTIDIANVQMYDRYFEVPMMVPYYGSPFSGIYGFPLNGPYIPYISPTDAANVQNMKIAIQYTYVKGYANTVISGGATAGSTTITVDDPTGIKQDGYLTIYDGGKQETVRAAADPVGQAVTITRPLLFSHSDKVGISALPADLKQACILIVNYLLKERGVNSITMEGATNPLMQKYDDKSDIKLAQDILDSYKRMVI